LQANAQPFMQGIRVGIAQLGHDHAEVTRGGIAGCIALGDQADGPEKPAAFLLISEFQRFIFVDHRFPRLKISPIHSESSLRGRNTGFIHLESLKNRTISYKFSMTSRPQWASVQ
jgi:hypothetical protein